MNYNKEQIIDVSSNFHFRCDYYLYSCKCPCIIALVAAAGILIFV